MLHSIEAIEICSLCSTFIFIILVHIYISTQFSYKEVKLKVELSQPPAKQYYDLTVLHEILCDWIANQHFIDTECSTKLLHG